MRIARSVRAVLMTALVFSCAAPASAQLYESVGTRAQGMAGAFVAVADDASATWWNPAGLARGAFFSALYEHGHLTEPADPDGASLASSSLTNGFAFGYPALGLSYYRLRISEIAPLSSTADPQAGRQDPGASGTRSLAVSQYGLTTGQSI